MASQTPIKRKLVIVGDGACGKTSLLSSFALGEFPKEYQPTVFDNYVAEIRLDEKPVHLALWDTAGQEEYERLRPMSYSKSHVILIAFSIDTPDSLENVTTKWIEEVRSICGPTIPVLLVGCKMDLRPDNEEHETPGVQSKWVTKEHGERVAQSIGARAYKECSALRMAGVDEVFEAATRVSMLMRDGVPTHGPTDDANRHHRRRSSGKVSSEREEGKGWGCCVVC
ncbi:ras-domain-containing protein [Coprinellus micaceus]|uniref:Ras-domain-containing protein n=1 Tax=Coprinellus micaceus TaxID=71717 RepID=A0A4Y7TTE6_COPMI|nr:ras-domain-containing protein [Coprinellus micaceus]